MTRWLSIALVGCAATSGTSEPSEPRLACAACYESQGPMSTFSKVEVDSSWQGKCWESNGECGGPLPTPGTPSTCQERTWRCKAVDHDIELRCENDGCRVAKPRTSPGSPGVRSSDLVFTKPGFIWITATFDPKHGKTRSERVQ